MTTKVLVVGAGVRGREHVAAFEELDDVELVAVVDPDPATARTVAGLGEVAGVDEVDVVVVATPPASHVEVVAESLEVARPRVLVCEKPLALDLGAGAAIVHACAAAGVALFAGHHWRLNPAFRRLRAAVAAGELGTVQHVRGICFGNLLDQGSHLADALRWIAGVEVEWVLAAAEDDPKVLNRLAPSELAWFDDPDHPAPAWLTAHGAFADGTRLTIEAGLLAPRGAGAVDDWRQARVVVHGSEGVAEAWASGAGSVRRFDGGREERPAAAAAWLDATAALARAVVAACRGATSDLASGADGMASLALVDACLRSANGAGLVRVGEVAAGAAGRAARRVEQVAPPSVSVVVNVDDDRGWAVEAVRSWNADQGHAGAVEVVVVSDGKDAAFDEQLRRVLTGTDQHLVLPGAPRVELWDRGARAARGDVVVLTEGHCAAEPGCLAALLEPLADERVHATVGRTEPVVSNAFSVADADAFAAGEATYGAPTDWRTVTVHAFAIRKATFLAVGGLSVEAGLYAEQLLTASLRAGGYAVAPAPGARVRHRYADRPRALTRSIEGIARGQAQLRARRPPSELESLLFPAGALDPLEAHRSTAAAALVGACLDRALWRDVRRWVPAAALGPRGRTALAGGMLRAAEVRGRLHRRPAAVAAAYADISERAVLHARRVVRAASGPPVRAGCDGDGTWTAAALDDHLTGAEDLERFDGHEFRWLRPAAALVTDLPPGRWQLTLGTGGIGRDPRAAGVRVRAGGRHVDAVVGADAVAVVARVRGAPQVWTIVTDRLDAGADGRRLGLPLESLTIAAR